MNGNCWNFFIHNRPIIKLLWNHIWFNEIYIRFSELYPNIYIFWVFLSNTSPFLTLCFHFNFLLHLIFIVGLIKFSSKFFFVIYFFTQVTITDIKLTCRRWILGFTNFLLLQCKIKFLKNMFSQCGSCVWFYASRVLHHVTFSINFLHEFII